MFQDGQILGEFEILERLGQGGMGAVYKARQISLDRFVALKTLQAALASDQEYIARFRREAKAAASLNHPNLVQVYSAGETDGLHWFAMEFVEGESAQVRVKRKGRLDPAEAIAIGIHVATALDHGWRKAQLIHRDIKPDNIFLSDDGEVKLGDLGLAKSVGETISLTMTGAAMGTPHYVSPEQGEGKKDVDLRSDIYSLGCTLFHLVAGQPPYGGETAMAVMLKHVTAPIPDPQSVWPGFPGELGRVVVKMMAKSPAARPQSYAEVIADLRRAHDALTGATMPATAGITAGSAAASGGGNAGPGTPPVRGARIRGRFLGCSIGLAVTFGVIILGIIGFNQFDLGRRAGNSRLRGETQRVQSLHPEGTAAGSPAAATKDAPLVNTLGMKFVPVPGTKVLFSTWDTRVQDYAAYVRANPKVDDSWTKQQKDGVPVGRELEHPVVGVSWEDAQAFCAWLTEKEQAEGKLPKGIKYRLPSDEEWSWAVGLPPESGATPAEKNGKNNVDFPWGKDYPPKGIVGNYADETFHAKFPLNENAKDWWNKNPWHEGYTDGYATTSPVGSFPANAYGLYDMSGNVWQWCEDWFDASQDLRVVRGGTWDASDRRSLLSSVRFWGKPMFRFNDYGFRCVLEPAPSAAPTTPAAASGAASTDAAGWISLFPYVDPSADAVMGDWTRVADGMHCETTKEWGRLQIPYQPPQEYDYRIAYTSHKENNEVIQIVAAMNHQFVLRGLGLSSIAFAQIRGQTVENSPATAKMPAPSPPNVRHESLLEVRRDHVTSYIDGKKMIEYKTDYSDMGLAGDFSLRDTHCIGVGGWFSVTFHDISVREVTGKGKFLRGAQSAPSMPSSTKLAATATKDAPFVNGLGMKFVPVPRTKVLFSIWDTRVQDYEGFARETKREWRKPNFGQGPSHPVVMVTWGDAEAFCAWLTERERGSGLLASNQRYRLPTDHEWSCAVGIGDREDPEKTPKEKDKVLPMYPWPGNSWPPPAGAGNYGGEEAKGHEIHSNQVVIAGYRDPYPETSPVGSFSPNQFGLFDMSGNVWQWCEDWFEMEHQNHVSRGGSFACSQFRNMFMLSARMGYGGATLTQPDIGFRCVLETGPAAAPVSDADGWINLLPLVDVKSDAVNGNWSREADGVNGGGGPGNLQLPYEPPQEYDFRMRYTALEGHSEGAPLLAAAGHQFKWVYGGGESWAKAGFTHVGGWAIDGPAIVQLDTPPLLNRRYECLVEVRRDHVTGYADGRKLLEWKTDYHDMSLDKLHPLPDALALGISVWGNKTIFHDISVREVTGKGKFLRGAQSAPAAPSSTKLAAAATKDAPFVNSLGMKFVPVPGTKVLFSIWDTRVQDYAAYARVNKVDDLWTKQEKDGVPVSREPEYPVVGVSWEDTQAFCQWLTDKEIAEGKLPKGTKYRLPTDEEWSTAVGLPTEQGATPAEKSGRNDVEFPWGTGYPPKADAGNYADESYHGKFPLKRNEKEHKTENPWIEGYADGYATTSPVGGFPANAHGLFDMGGNVWQWCGDRIDAVQKDHVVRGASWANNERSQLLSSKRGHNTPTHRHFSNGFRCVLAPAP